MTYVPDNPVHCMFCKQFIINQHNVCELCNVIYITNSKNLVQEIIVVVSNTVRVKFVPHIQQAELLILENLYFRKITSLKFKLIQSSIQNIYNKVYSIIPFI